MFYLFLTYSHSIFIKSLYNPKTSLCQIYKICRNFASKYFMFNFKEKEDD